MINDQSEEYIDEDYSKLKLSPVRQGMIAAKDTIDSLITEKKIMYTLLVHLRKIFQEQGVTLLVKEIDETLKKANC